MIYGGKFGNIAALDAMGLTEFKMFYDILEKQTKLEAEQRKKEAARMRARQNARRGKVR